jgi:hypothetical protein
MVSKQVGETAKKVSDSEIREMLIEIGMAQQRYWNNRSPLALQHNPRIWGKLEDMETKKVQGYGKEELYREAKESGLVADNKELTDEGIAHQKNLRAGHVSLGEKGTEFFYSGPSVKERKQNGNLKREIDEFDKEVRSIRSSFLEYIGEKE